MAAKNGGTWVKYVTLGILIIGVIGGYSWKGLTLLGQQKKECESHADSAATQAVTNHNQSTTSHPKMREAIEKATCALDSVGQMRKEQIQKKADDDARWQRLDRKLHDDSIQRVQDFRAIMRKLDKMDGGG
jgi:hypothetical protein